LYRQEDLKEGVASHRHLVYSVFDVLWVGGSGALQAFDKAEVKPCAVSAPPYDEDDALSHTDDDLLV
jgi:hypothetical protein